MCSVFYGASAFNRNIGSWNTAAVANFTYSFYKAAAFNQNIGSWNVAAATTVVSMFQARAISSLPCQPRVPCSSWHRMVRSICFVSWRECVRCRVVRRMRL
jgi:surface protein